VGGGWLGIGSERHLKSRVTSRDHTAAAATGAVAVILDSQTLGHDPTVPEPSMHAYRLRSPQRLLPAPAAGHRPCIYGCGITWGKWLGLPDGEARAFDRRHGPIVDMGSTNVPTFAWIDIGRAGEYG
jgi:hypothetical protein